VLRLNVTTLDFRFGDANPELREKAQKMVGTVDRAILMVRSLATSLRPAALSGGIVSALEWLVQEYAESTGIICRLHVPADDDIPLDEVRAMVVFRIIQESLTNVLRHSGADCVDITLSSAAGSCEVEVHDNGKGFDPGSAGRVDSYGIIGMQERALILKGSLDIATAEVGGTTLKLRIPINGPHEAGMASEQG
jgi:signal transduction histidine kinase